MIARNIPLEREFTYEATKGLDVDPWRAIVHAETRARTLSHEYVSNPRLILTGRDRVHDVREEIVDARNHIVFWFQEHLDEVGSEQAHDMQIALRHLLLAYEVLK